MRPTALYLAFVSIVLRVWLRAERNTQSARLPWVTRATKGCGLGALTCLEVFGELGTQIEERGLPFGGISLERGNGAPNVEVIFGGNGAVEPSHLTYVIANVQQITPKRGLDGRDEALEIVVSLGEKRVVCFEPETRPSTTK